MGRDDAAETFDVPNDLKILADDWRANSATDPDKITEQKAARNFGAALVHWIKLRDAQRYPRKGHLTDELS